jgi:hypothetical protein
LLLTGETLHQRIIYSVSYHSCWNERSATINTENDSPLLL